MEAIKQELIVTSSLVMVILLALVTPCAAQSDADAPTTDYGDDFGVTGTYIKMGVGSYGYLADYSLGYGLQYPVGSEHEHLAIGWWGEGYFVGYYDSGSNLHECYAYASNGIKNLNFVSETDLSTADEYKVRDVTTTSDGRIRLTHEFTLPKDKKFVILEVTLENIGSDTVTGLKYKRIVDWDLDRTPFPDCWDYLGDSDGKPIMLVRDGDGYPYAAVATSSSTPADLHDADAWGDYLGYNTYIDDPDPDGTYMDGNALFEWNDITLNPGDSVSFKIYYIFGDSKDEVLSGYDELEGGASVPEFPTVVLPVAMTILGVALLMFRRREI
ncbi:MAG TPA: hypothetical protein ENI32_02730 [Candidatus Syntrophoarchaeum butanivorans]|uniref:PEF-CTERM protein sorting domain-containing protein n=1 Tax=Candidatus Syntropharchaeum butanivorans TaxID=1839936 RepID=A0A7J2RZY7_9EURY|nr:hypothetical protein [Candidatus Syntrophoarchaeum butanivorans]